MKSFYKFVILMPTLLSVLLFTACDTSSSLYNDGMDYLSGAHDRPLDHTKAFECFKKSADMGNENAQIRVGFCYQNGTGVEQNKAEAVKWYRKAAEQGNASAQCLLGDCYCKGNGVEQDKEEGARWLHKSAQQGFEGAKDVLREHGLD